jgi:hypothetical protein
MLGDPGLQVGDRASISDPASADTWIVGYVTGWSIYQSAGEPTITTVWLSDVHRLYAPGGLLRKKGDGEIPLDRVSTIEYVQTSATDMVRFSGSLTATPGSFRG